MTKIFIGSDHGGFELKSGLIQHLSLDHVITDRGPYGSDSVDYPTYAKAVCQDILNEDNAVGILICTTGIGMSIAANRHTGIRAALCRTVKDAKLARHHNNANVLVLGAANTPLEEALNMVSAFISESFDGGRHLRRIQQLDN